MSTSTITTRIEDDALRCVGALGLHHNPLALVLTHRLVRAGFPVSNGEDHGGVEIRETDAYAPDLLVSWSPHCDAFIPLDSRITRTELAMGEFLDTLLPLLGFEASRLGVSLSYRVTGMLA